MKIVGQILLACILLAMLQYVVIAALVLLFTGLLWGALFRPQETFGLLALLLVSSLVGAQRHPLLGRFNRQQPLVDDRGDLSGC
jgi:hypothetical protein